MATLAQIGLRLLDWLGRIKDAWELLPWFPRLLAFFVGPGVLVWWGYQIEIMPLGKIMLFLGAFAAYVIIGERYARWRLGSATTAVPASRTEMGVQLPQVTVALEVKEFTSRTVADFKDMYVGRTALQGDLLIAPYKGLWLDVMGKIAFIVPNGLGATVMLHTEENSIECHFDSPTEVDSLRRYGDGDEIRARGKISPQQNGRQLYLDDCELLP